MFIHKKTVYWSNCIYGHLPLTLAFIPRKMIVLAINTQYSCLYQKWKKETTFHQITIFIDFISLSYILLLKLWPGAPSWSSGSVLDHRSLPSVFESRRGHIWRLFRLSLHLITFGSRSAHLAYLVHKSGHKTSIIIIIITKVMTTDHMTIYDLFVAKDDKNMPNFIFVLFHLEAVHPITFYSYNLII